MNGDEPHRAVLADIVLLSRTQSAGDWKRGLPDILGTWLGEPFPESHNFIIVIHHCQVDRKNTFMEIHFNLMNYTAVILLFVARELYDCLNMLYKSRILQKL